MIIKCDICGKETELEYDKYIKRLKEGKFYCKHCIPVYKNYQAGITIEQNDKEMYEHLKDKRFGYLSFKSSYILEFICSGCKNTFKAPPADFSTRHRGYNCKGCSDGISFNNRLAFNIFREVKAEFESEFPIGNYRYDFKINYNNRNILLELDGGFHGENTKFISAEQSNKRDSLKTKLAKEKGFEIIRIECKNLRTAANDIINGIKENFPDYNYNIDFNKLILSSRKSIYVEVWELFKSGKSREEIIKELNIQYDYCHRILKYGNDIKVIDYKYRGSDKDDKKEKIKELWLQGKRPDEIYSIVGFSEVSSVIKYLKNIYIETKDKLFDLSECDKYYKNLDENIIYSSYKLSELWGIDIRKIYRQVYATVKRDGKIRKCKYQILNRQQAYLEQRVTGIKIKEAE